MLTLDKVYHASYVLKNVIRSTDLIHAPNIRHDCKVYLKTENLQVTGSFKVRGAYYKISQLSDEEKSHGVIACSAGQSRPGCGTRGDEERHQVGHLPARRSPDFQSGGDEEVRRSGRIGQGRVRRRIPAGPGIAGPEALYVHPSVRRRKRHRRARDDRTGAARSSFRKSTRWWCRSEEAA